jgi:hypothetical protein
MIVRSFLHKKRLYQEYYGIPIPFSRVYCHQGKLSYLKSSGVGPLKLPV